MLLLPSSSSSLEEEHLALKQLALHQLQQQLI